MGTFAAQKSQFVVSNLATGACIPSGSLAQMEDSIM